MPKVYHQKARKDYPNDGIKKGDMYYSWSLRPTPYSSRTYRQLTPPKPWQLTSSPFLQELYQLQERVSEATFDDVDDIIADIENLRDETQEKFDNMPEGLQQGDTGILLEERVDGLDSWISDIESARDNAPEEDDYEDTEEYESAFEDALDELRSTDPSL